MTNFEIAEIVNLTLFYYMSCIVSMTILCCGIFLIIFFIFLKIENPDQEIKKNYIDTMKGRLK